MAGCLPGALQTYVSKVFGVYGVKVEFVATQFLRTLPPQAWAPQAWAPQEWQAGLHLDYGFKRLGQLLKMESVATVF